MKISASPSAKLKLVPGKTSKLPKISTPKPSLRPNTRVPGRRKPNLAIRKVSAGDFGSSKINTKALDVFTKGTVKAFNVRQAFKGRHG